MGDAFVQKLVLGINDVGPTCSTWWPTCGARHREQSPVELPPQSMQKKVHCGAGRERLQG